MSTSIVETVKRRELENKDATSIKILPSQDASAPAATEKTTASLMGTGGYDYPGMPQFTDLHKKRRWQLEHMAGAFRVFARKGFTEGTAGHISVRDPVDPSTFWINP